MSYVPVDVYFETTALIPAPVQGVLVRVYSENGTLVHGQATTNSDGVASFLLPSGFTYQLRSYKAQMAIGNPRYIEVTEEGPNLFTCFAEDLTPQAPLDPRLCTVYGTFRRPDGALARNVEIHFITNFKPLVLDDSAVLTERLRVRTDNDGYVQLNLIRNGQYDVTVQGLEDTQQNITIPDAPNAKLADLLFPTVVSIELFPSGPFVLHVGDELQVSPAVMASNGERIEGAAIDDVDWSSSNTGVLTVVPAGGKLTLTAVAVGTAQIRAVRANTTNVRYPNTPIAGVPVEVTVS